MEILQLSALRSFVSGEYPATELFNPAQLTWGSRYTASALTQQKTPPPTVFLLLLWAVA
jgi:hypothetical protein